jgi:peptidoglycan/LPS O-acetylase OafA/YrhL
MSAPNTSSPAARADYEAGTEGLRGFCALIVLYTHVLAPFRDVDPGYAPSSVFWWIEAGQGAVLLFFVLSGYVIGLTNQRPFSGTALRDYARRRALRLLPLYVLAVAASAAVRPVDSWSTVLGNLLFLQNELPIAGWHVPLLASNTNLWSLNYEMLYYTLFVGVWLAPRRWPLWLLGTLCVGVLAWRIPNGGNAIATYAAGWVFWLAGFGLARTAKPAESDAARLPWPALLLLWLATWHLKPLWSFAHRFELLPDGSSWMNYSFCDIIPACVALLMAASGRRPRKAGIITLAALCIPLGFTLWSAARGRLMEPGHSLYYLLVAIASLLWFWRPSSHWFVRLAPIGMISYALYIFQRPVQWLVLDWLPLPSGTVQSFAFRALVTVVLTLVVSYVAERVLHPKIRQLLSPRKKTATVPMPATAT